MMKNHNKCPHVLYVKRIFQASSPQDSSIFFSIQHGQLFTHGRLLIFREKIMSARLFDRGRLLFFKEKFTMVVY